MGRCMCQLGTTSGPTVRSDLRTITNRRNTGWMNSLWFSNLTAQLAQSWSLVGTCIVQLVDPTMKGMRNNKKLGTTATL